MVNFMCQLDWAMGYPDIWSNFISSLSVRMFLHGINIYTRRLSKTDCSPYCGWALSNLLDDQIEQKDCHPPSKKELILPNCCQTGNCGFPAFRFGLEHQLFLG